MPSRKKFVRVPALAAATALVSVLACARGGPEERGALADDATGSAHLRMAVIAKDRTMLAASPEEPARAFAVTHNREPACPSGMILIEGEYCPEAEQTCLEWMDPPSSRYAHFRCKRYAKPAICKAPKVHKRYCIDATERTEPGTNLPRHHMSWTSSKALCESEGARLCRESEWIFACEGEEMRPYPYGWERDSEACNVDRNDGIGRVGRLVDHREPAASHARCASAFGVQDMAGNVEEWTQADGPGVGAKMGWKEVLKGSWWIPSRHACRQFQVGHNDVYRGGETGTRCCRDASAQEVASR